MSASQLRFAVTGTAPVFLRNRDVQDVTAPALGQALGLTDGSQQYAYDIALSRTVYQWEFSHVPKPSYDAFAAWFSDVAQGVFNTFSIQIPPGNLDLFGGAPRTLENCRFSITSIPIVDDGPGEGWYSFRLEFFQETAGPTGPPTTEPTA